MLVKEPAWSAKDAELEPAAIVSDEGAVKRLFTVEMTMSAPPGAALFVNVTVQVLELFGPNSAGVQAVPEIKPAVSRLTLVDTELPAYVAVRVAMWSAVTAAAVMMKVAEVAAAGTATDCGRVRSAALLARVTEMPPEGAALVRVRAQVPEALEPNPAGLQETDDTSVTAPRAMTVFTELAPSVAVRVAF